MQNRRGTVLSMDETLLTIAQANYPAYVSMFQQKRYGAAFRTAARNLNYDVIELLCRDKVKNAIGLDVNGQSSNGNTALDWAFDPKEYNAYLVGKITDLLMNNGAKTSEELSSLNKHEASNSSESSEERPTLSAGI